MEKTKKKPQGKRLRIEDAYQTIKKVLSRHKRLRDDKEKIKEEIAEAVKPFGFNYGGAVTSYLLTGIRRVDAEAREAFWAIFDEDCPDDFWKAYYGLQLEGLYDMVELDMLQLRDVSTLPEPSKPKKIGTTEKAATIWDVTGESRKIYLDQMSFPWVRQVLDHARNEGKPVLIIGETGTSKEAVARAVYNLSNRKGEKYEVINCAAFPETLLESELFGHKKGSFTGATADRKGILERVNRGTLFLDEIGKSSLAVQSKLLRAIEFGEINPIGSDKSAKIDVRFIFSAQPNDIHKEGGILPDLKFRMGYPYAIHMPTLKERFNQCKGNTYQILIYNSLNFALNKMKKRDAMFTFKIAEDSYELLKNHEYEGNYRELENILMSAVDSAIRDERDELRPEDFTILKKRKSSGEPSIDTKDVRLRDIFEYAKLQAKKLEASIVIDKIQSLIDAGKNIRAVLTEEYAQDGEKLTNSQYVKFIKKIHTITSKKIKQFKTRQQSN